MTPEEIVGAAIEAAAAGLKVGELPIGAVVLAGDEVVGWAYTRERGHGRRLVHAGLLAMMEADERLGWADHTEPLRLGVNLEPCVMCLGAAMALGCARCTTAWSPPTTAPPGSRGAGRRAPARAGTRRRSCAAASGAGRAASSSADTRQPRPT